MLTLFNTTKFRRRVIIHAKAISIYRKSNRVCAAILDLYYDVARPPTKPRWWLE